MIFNTPESYAAGLKEYNFDVINFANNHAFDQDKDGLFSTLEYLKGQNISVVGAGEALQETWKPAIIEKNGIKICFIGASYSSINDNGLFRHVYVARIDQTEMMRDAVGEAKKLCDFTVMSMHAGIEYTRNPTPMQRDFAHAAIDA
jgi:poly-gamma-glutamate capsule biosynthesis protein CapA/YwtB (metallophosphatase superfamily)